MIKEALEKIGLTSGEINVYLALTGLGASSTRNIIKKSKVSGSKVYEVLDRLIDKGLVSYIIKNGVRYFEATRPERILDFLEEKSKEIESEKESIQKIIPELILKAASNPRSEAKIFTGWEGVKTANDDIVRTLKKGEEWLEMGLSEQPKSWERYFQHKQQLRIKKGIIHKILINEVYKDFGEKRASLELTEVKYLPKSISMPSSTVIYANKIIIFIPYSDTPMAIMIESKDVAESYRKYFYALWEKFEK
jgi:HTH-type transcriptional regulator, sugar sensing transcriptional regulator